MRTAIVCGGPPIGGKEIMALELGEGLRAKGCGVEFVTSHWTNGDFKARLDALGFPSHQVWFGFISATLRLDCIRMTAHQLSRWPHLLGGYYRFLRRSNPQTVIHTNWHSLLMILPLVKPERDIFWLHEVVPDRPQYRRVFGWFARRVRCFIPVSHAVAESLRRFGIPEEKIRVIHNGIADIAIQQSIVDKHVKGVRVGITGRIGDWKGHEDLLEAFALIAEQHPDAELHVYGGGAKSFENKLLQQSDTLKIASRIRWHGFIADRTQMYRELDICVVPSRFEEPFGLAALEPAFFGIPVIATKRGGLPEIVEEGITGFLVEARNPQQLAERLCDLLKDVGLRQRMGEAARRRAQSHFGHDRFINDFVHLLNNSCLT